MKRRKYCDSDEDEINADGDESGKEQVLWSMQWLKTDKPQSRRGLYGKSADDVLVDPHVLTNLRGRVRHVLVAGTRLPCLRQK